MDVRLMLQLQWVMLAWLSFLAGLRRAVWSAWQGRCSVAVSKPSWMGSPTSIRADEDSGEGCRGSRSEGPPVPGRSVLLVGAGASDAVWSSGRWMESDAVLWCCGLLPPDIYKPRDL